jgi:hypothetical protein
MDIVGRHELAPAELCRQNFIEAIMAVQVKFVSPVLQLHGENESDKTQVMITVKVADENMVYAMKVYLITHHLHLGSFAAINEKLTVLNLQKLGAGKASIGGHGAA